MDAYRLAAIRVAQTYRIIRCVVIRRQTSIFLPQRIDRAKTSDLRVILPYAVICRPRLAVLLLVDELLPCVDACHCYRCAERCVVIGADNISRSYRTPITERGPEYISSPRLLRIRPAVLSRKG